VPENLGQKEWGVPVLQGLYRRAWRFVVKELWECEVLVFILKIDFNFLTRIEC